jgi:hypothetical protein
MADFWVNGIVAARDQQPYIQLSNEQGMIAQMSMAEARQVAQDIQTMCARTEADAMILQFFSEASFPDGLGSDLMIAFREFRAKLDDEAVGHTHRGEVDG